MPQKRRSQSWTELKQAGNECFRAGQYGEAVNLYSQSIQLLEKSGQKNKEDLGILYSNRAASYLKVGNCSECIKDCTRSLELVPFGLKALLRRASAYEALERYRQAYVDYKTVLQIDWNIPAAHDGVNRMTKALTDIDGPSWREKLPPIPTVPMSVKESLAQAASSASSPQQNSVIDNKKKAPGPEAAKKAKALKEEGNAFVKKGEHKKAVEKYTQSLGQDPKEVTTYTNRALCYLSLKMYKEAISDCDEALRLDSANIKAFYRRAQANKELKNKKSCIEDLNSVLKLEPNNAVAQKLLQEVQKMK
ncbi:mitochondrial import receptor subunit TOM34-like [Sinocyclocheilus rhinocerous]|uniref:Mitochondrial import receptor subunit TOM34-like n=1 Tax=Sinocyclocheilus rhinocerous TaxID=307959 RepID=A0A673L582_9TELE|nr:PREDICTED: mitochondrial import receptor subunit TOM34-like [Sinocyclocheilus rhinocerous]XP_016367752.1 PREDICTED: mitochondrial import receptor subunit TOM34-like [Sinocyclocheilus rhinocerous]